MPDSSMEKCRRVRTSVEGSPRVLSRKEETISYMFPVFSLCADWMPCKAPSHLPLLCDIKLGFLGAHSKSRGPAASTLSGVMVIAMLLSGMCPGPVRVSCLRVMNSIFLDQIHSLHCHGRCSKSDESDSRQGCAWYAQGSSKPCS